MRDESILERIDSYLENKKSSEITLVFAMIFALIGFLVYSYIYPITDKKLRSTQKKLLGINKKLKSEQLFAKSVTRNGDIRYFIKKRKKEIEDAKILLERTTYSNAYIDNKLKELSYLLFDNKNWAKFLDSIAEVAQTNHVKIKLLENSINKPTLQKIEQILTLKVEFSGRFKNVMKFINSIEESRLVVDIFDMKLEGKTGVKGEISIAVWGMKY